MVTITIVEPIPKSYTGYKRKAAELNLISPPVGDLDNKIKAITDGLNGIAYIDDKQINCLAADRRYGTEHVIHVEIKRNGISMTEVDRYAQTGSFERST
jgi:Holliday junction resolvase RusA-like endonuclease